MLAIIKGCTKDFLMTLLDSNEIIIRSKKHSKKYVHLYDISGYDKIGDVLELPYRVTQENIIYYNLNHGSPASDYTGYIECFGKDYENENSKTTPFVRKFISK